VAEAAGRSGVPAGLEYGGRHDVSAAHAGDGAGVPGVPRSCPDRRGTRRRRQGRLSTGPERPTEAKGGSRRRDRSQLAEIFNTDQGSQFTSAEFTQPLLARGVKISMDGRGRALDNVFVERLWRTVKYDEVYLKSYCSQIDAYTNLATFFRFYNEYRPHSAFGITAPKTPMEVYRQPVPLAINQ
jgi:transposase InsO family protein